SCEGRDRHQKSLANFSVRAFLACTFVTTQPKEAKRSWLNSGAATLAVVIPSSYVTGAAQGLIDLLISTASQ
ncbi:hypothetical protein, partial [Pseudomonas aeruginosa]